jgi:hypothetical protein
LRDLRGPLLVLLRLSHERYQRSELVIAGSGEDANVFYSPPPDATASQFQQPLDPFCGLNAEDFVGEGRVRTRDLDDVPFQLWIAALKPIGAHLFAGAMGHAKNPSSHRDLNIQRMEAVRLIVFASYLLELAELRWLIG